MLCHSFWKKPIPFVCKIMPHHRSILTKDSLADADIQLLSWPAVSPDLNPIENSWEVLRDALKQHPLPPTVTNFLHPVNGMVLMPTHIYLQLAATAPQQSLGDCDSAYIPPSILRRKWRRLLELPNTITFFS